VSAVVRLQDSNLRSAVSKLMKEMPDATTEQLAEAIYQALRKDRRLADQALWFIARHFARPGGGVSASTPRTLRVREIDQLARAADSDERDDATEDFPIANVDLTTPSMRNLFDVRLGNEQGKRLGDAVKPELQSEIAKLSAHKLGLAKKIRWFELIAKSVDERRTIAEQLTVKQIADLWRRACSDVS
jgi:hypothetical protein